MSYNYKEVKKSYIELQLRKAKKKEWDSINIKEISKEFDSVIPYVGVKKDAYIAELTAIEYSEEMPTFVWAKLYEKVHNDFKDILNEKDNEALLTQIQILNYCATKEAKQYNNICMNITLAKKDGAIFINRENFIRHLMNQKLYNGTTSDLINASEEELDKLSQDMNTNYIIY